MKSKVIQGDALEVLRELPSESFDCCVTSPPYWRKRLYEAGGIGWEETAEEYVEALLPIFARVKRVLKRAGSLWINIADSYHRKSMQGIPWKLASSLAEDGWFVRNDVIWSKVPGPDNARDRLSFCHEHLFHLSLMETGYHYDDSAVRRGGASGIKSSVESASRRIRDAATLTQREKESAEAALSSLVKEGVTRFVMMLRGQRAFGKRGEWLRRDGFCFLRYDPRGGKVGDVWDLSNRSARRGRDSVDHGAAFPEDLIEMPIRATCPRGGIVLDPFCGTGTTLAVAGKLGRRFVGIDLSEKYVSASKERVALVGK